MAARVLKLNKRRYPIRKRKADSALSQRYLIEVDGPNGRKYEAKIRKNLNGEYEIYYICRLGAGKKAKWRTISARIVDKTKRRHHHGSLKSKSYNRKDLSEDTLIGRNVIIHESTPYRTRTFVGKIVSLSSKITGTPAGEGGLPPSDE